MISKMVDGFLTLTYCARLAPPRLRISLVSRASGWTRPTRSRARIRRRPSHRLRYRAEVGCSTTCRQSRGSPLLPCVPPPRRQNNDMIEVYAGEYMANCAALVYYKLGQLAVNITQVRRRLSGGVCGRSDPSSERNCRRCHIRVDLRCCFLSVLPLLRRRTCRPTRPLASTRRRSSTFCRRSTTCTRTTR